MKCTSSFCLSAFGCKINITSSDWDFGQKQCSAWIQSKASEELRGTLIKVQKALSKGQHILQRMHWWLLKRGLTSKSPGSMACEMMMGLSFRLVMSQYSLASMLTFRWSIPSWQMSACKSDNRPFIQPTRISSIFFFFSQNYNCVAVKDIAPGKKVGCWKGQHYLWNSAFWSGL